MRLSRKVALISGGARGQGAAEARLFAREGAAVVIGDLREEEGRSLEAEIVQSGGRALFVRLNVASEKDWQAAVARTVKEFGKLDILVNNAAILRLEGVEKTTREGWDQVMGVNATGVFFGMKHAVTGMRRAGGGAIVYLLGVCHDRESLGSRVSCLEGCDTDSFASRSAGVREGQHQGELGLSGCRRHRDADGGLFPGTP